MYFTPPPQLQNCQNIQADADFFTIIATDTLVASVVHSI